MHIITRGLLLLLVTLSLMSCNKALKPEQLPANIAAVLTGSMCISKTVR